MAEKRPTLKIEKELLAAADDFVASKCWETMRDIDVFGVDDPATGQVVLCTVVGNLGEAFGLAVHRDLDAFYELIGNGARGQRPDMSQWFRKFNGLLMFLVPKAELGPDDLKMTERAAYKPSVRGKWPQFRSCLPKFVPWTLDRGEAVLMSLCLQQAVEMASRVARQPDLLGGDPFRAILVRVCRDQDGHREWHDALMPPPLFEPAPPPETPAMDQLKLRRLRSGISRIGGRWEIDCYVSEMPVQERGERPYFPYCVLIVDAGSGMILGNEIVGHDFVPGMVDFVLETATQLSVLPEEIVVRQDDVQTVLEPLAKGLGCRIGKAKRLPALDPALREIQQFLRSRM